MVPFQQAKRPSGSTISPDSAQSGVRASSVACSSPRYLLDDASNASTAPPLAPCLLSLFDAGWFGSLSAAAEASAAAAKLWYAAGGAATGSAPSLYDPDDAFGGPAVSALMPEALPAANTSTGARNGAAGPAMARGGGGVAPGNAATTARRGVPTKSGGREAGASSGSSRGSGYSGGSVPQWQQHQLQLQQQQQQQQQQQAYNHHHQQQQQAVPIRSSGGGADVAASSSGATGGEHQQQQQPVLGTWAHRQYKLPLPGRPAESNQQQQQQSPGPSRTRKGERQDHQQQEQQQQQQPPLCSAAALSSSVAQPIPGARQPAKPSGAAAAAGGARGHTTAAAAAAAAEAAAKAGAGGGPHRRISEGDGEEEEEEEEEAIARAAWRWRFAKRWQAEQARQLDPAASAGDGDGMEELVAYLAACGHPTGDLACTMSDNLDGSAGSMVRLLGTAGSMGLLGQEAMLVGEMSRNASFTGSPAQRGGSGSVARGGAGGGAAAAALARPAAVGAGAGGAAAAAAPGAARRTDGAAGGGTATRELTAAARRASALLRTQTDLDRAAGARWREAEAGPGGGALWCGALLEAVEIDAFGSMKFLLVRLRDSKTGRQKLLVRGSNYASEGKLLEALHRQLVAAAAAHGVPAEPIEAIGGGVAEWRRDRDRHLHLGSAFASPHSSGPSGPMAAAEVLNLAGVLVKQSLPLAYRVTTDTGKTL